MGDPNLYGTTSQSKAIVVCEEHGISNDGNVNHGDGADEDDEFGNRINADEESKYDDPNRLGEHDSADESSSSDLTDDKQEDESEDEADDESEYEADDESEDEGDDESEYESDDESGTNKTIAALNAGLMKLPKLRNAPGDTCWIYIFGKCSIVDVKMVIMCKVRATLSFTMHEENKPDNKAVKVSTEELYTKAKAAHYEFQAENEIVQFMLSSDVLGRTTCDDWRTAIEYVVRHCAKQIPDAYKAKTNNTDVVKDIVGPFLVSYPITLAVELLRLLTDGDKYLTYLHDNHDRITVQKCKLSALTLQRFLDSRIGSHRYPWWITREDPYQWKLYIQTICQRPVWTYLEWAGACLFEEALEIAGIELRDVDEGLSNIEMLLQLKHESHVEGRPIDNSKFRIRNHRLYNLIFNRRTDRAASIGEVKWSTFDNTAGPPAMDTPFEWLQPRWIYQMVKGSSVEWYLKRFPSIMLIDVRFSELEFVKFSDEFAKHVDLSGKTRSPTWLATEVAEQD